MGIPINSYEKVGNDKQEPRLEMKHGPQQPKLKTKAGAAAGRGSMGRSLGEKTQATAKDRWGYTDQAMEAAAEEDPNNRKSHGWGKEKEPGDGKAKEIMARQRNLQNTRNILRGAAAEKEQEDLCVVIYA
ncbi:hypothetical protein E3N88_27337 [Mikania micrantha]|uniref:Uncharacterized protein n=1 Tax=Mikania micrantha TaxID=192012 RepID=A0A5N6MXF3_9ASTR|nr:hypothetical protein E3N88_27337 [Mikania micrantha]